MYNCSEMYICKSVSGLINPAGGAQHKWSSILKTTRFSNQWFSVLGDATREMGLFSAVGPHGSQGHTVLDSWDQLWFLFPSVALLDQNQEILNKKNDRNEWLTRRIATSTESATKHVWCRLWPQNQSLSELSDSSSSKRGWASVTEAVTSLFR